MKLYIQYSSIRILDGFGKIFHDTNKFSGIRPNIFYPFHKHHFFSLKK